MENLKQLQAEWFAENAPFGKALGYPDCCIKAFCDQPPALLRNTGATKEDVERYEAGCIQGVYTGFIPCIRHAREIKAGKCTLESLIKNRNSKFPPFWDM